MFIFYVLCVIYVFIGSTEAQYDDVRCKCVCPEVTASNGSVASKPVYIKTIQNPSDCVCENVVEQAILDEHTNFCHLCECRWERRNTTTMKVVVIVIICLVSLLLLYMLFLLCLDPLVSRRQQRAYRQHTDQDSVSAPSATEAEGVRARAPPGRRDLTSRLEHEMSRVRGAQQKWVGQVQEQRRNIYDRHSMLN